MKMSRRAGLRRVGFTLVELLVVIAIIGILAALIIPAVFYIFRTGKQTVTFNEMLQMDNAIQTFRETYNVDYVPSQIKLCEKFGQYQISPENGGVENPLDRDSVTFLTRIFPRITDASGGTSLWSSRGIDWNNDGNYNTPPVVLEGDRCLVFFLGGIPLRTPPTVSIMGFNTDPRDPAKPNDSNRKPPIMNFDTGRLYVRTTPTPSNPLQLAAGTAGYPSYLDPYFTGSSVPGQDKPFLYFSNYGINNGYSKYGQSDCASFGVNPYCSATTAPVQYYNPKSQQIISAGLDQTFAPGGLYTPANIGAFQAAGKDDQGNFTGGKLIGAGF